MLEPPAGDMPAPVAAHGVAPEAILIVRPAATMRGLFDQGSAWNVRSEICTRVLAGASGARVILSILAALPVTAR